MKKLFFTLLILIPLGIPAQTFLERSELGLAGGGMNYLGDLNDQSMFGRVNLAGSLFVRCNIDQRWAIAVSGGYGHIECRQDCVPRRNLSFRSYIAEGNIRAEFNFFPYGLRKGTQKRFTPFIFCGIGLLGFNPQAQYFDELGALVWYDLQPLGTEGQGSNAYPDRQRYSLIEICMPFGVGMRWRLAPGLHFAAEYGWRKTWTDYLDDVSTTYVGSQVLLDEYGENTISHRLADRSSEVVAGYVNAPGIKRGDTSLDDWYAYFNISLSVSMELLFGWLRGKTCEH